MADELTATGALYYRDSNGVEQSLAVIADLIDVANKKTTRLQQNIGLVEEALQLGEITLTGSIVMIVNRDTTNFVEIKSGTGGLVIAKLTAERRFLILPVGSSITAPYAIADTGACLIDILIISP